MPDPKTYDDRAFPGRTYLTRDHSLGMTLRDYFAGQALVGQLAANPTVPGLSPDQLRTVVALNAYEYADAMLRAREKGGDDASS